MIQENSISAEIAESTCTKNSNSLEDLKVVGRFEVTCVGADGVVKWEETINNLVVTAGKVDILEKYFRTSYTPAWYAGLTVSSGYAASDTLAIHGGWTEFTSYTVSGGNTTNRGTLAFSAAAANGANGQITTSAAAAFTVTAGATIDGALVTQTQAKATTTGVLWSCGTFSGGARVVQNTDTLNVSYTATIT